MILIRRKTSTVRMKLMGRAEGIYLHEFEMYFYTILTHLKLTGEVVLRMNLNSDHQVIAIYL